VHGGIGYTWEHDAHLHLRRALVSAALLGGDAPAADVFDRTAADATRENSLDLPPEAEELRTQSAPTPPRSPHWTRRPSATS